MLHAAMKQGVCGMSRPSPVLRLCVIRQVKERQVLGALVTSCVVVFTCDKQHGAFIRLTTGGGFCAQARCLHHSLWHGRITLHGDSHP